MLFYPVREITVTPKYVGLDFEDVVLTIRDNVNIAAWCIPASRNASPPKEFLEIKGGHYDGFFISGYIYIAD
jgi:hypothetical protein